MWDFASWLTAALGALIGLVVAFTGAGGGVLAIPLLVLGLHLTMQQAAPVGLLAVGVASAIGAWMGLRQGKVRYRAAGVIGAVGMVAAPFGVWAAQVAPARPLMVVFAGILLLNAKRILLHKPLAHDAQVPCRVNPNSRRLTWTAPCAVALAGTGAFSGFLSGLLGVGGGFVIVPALVRRTDLDIRSVQLTSMAVIALVSVSGVCASALHGSLPGAVAWPFTLGSVVALLLFKPLADRAHPGVLQKAFAAMCLLVALVMLARAFGINLPGG
jgi:hypothetical protein